MIVGGESGPHARPFDLAWARSLVQQCQDAGVAVFVKQLGSRPVLSEDDAAEAIRDLDANGHSASTIERAHVEGRIRLRHNHGGDPEEWPEDLRIRQWPDASEAVAS